MAAQNVALEKVKKDLNCLVCLNTYTNPKLLQCHHVFCRDCLERLAKRAQLICPKCREITPIPPEGVGSLRPAFQVNTLLTILEELKKATYCPEHLTRELETFCETCDKLICLVCGIKQHSGHTCKLVNELFDSYKEDILSSLAPVKECHKLACKAKTDVDARCEEIINQKNDLEEKICEHTRQIHEAVESRKAELIDKLCSITEKKLQNLASQRAEIETTSAQLSKYCDTVTRNLETSSQGEVVKMKTSVDKQAKELADSFQPDFLKLEVAADMIFSRQPSLIHESSFGLVDLEGSPDPAQCYINEIESHKIVGSKCKAVLQTIDFTGQPCRNPVKFLECELISELTEEKVKVDSEYANNGQYDISYSPRVKGRNKLHIKISGQHIKESPYHLRVKLPTKKIGDSVLTFRADRPKSVAISKRGDIFVADAEASIVTTYSPCGKKYHSYIMHSVDETLRGMTLDNLDNVLINDSQIKKFTPEGRLIIKRNLVGKSKRKLKDICTAVMTADAPSSACVAESLGFRAGLFFGKVCFLKTRRELVGSIYIAFNHSNMKAYVVNTDDQITILNPDFTFCNTFGEHGNGKGEFDSPSGITCDIMGYVYVADTGNHRIQVFTPEGEYIRKFGNTGEEKNRLYRPHGIAVDSDGTVYVSQPYKHCISVYSSNGDFVTSFSTRLEGEQEQEYGPTGLAVDCNGVLYVCDPLANKIKVF